MDSNQFSLKDINRNVTFQTFGLLSLSHIQLFKYLYLGFYVFRNPFLQILKWISRYIQPCYSFFSKWMNSLHFLELFCASFKMSYFQSRKSSWRETTQGQLSFFKHWKWNVLLSFVGSINNCQLTQASSQHYPRLG